MATVFALLCAGSFAYAAKQKSETAQGEKNPLAAPTATEAAAWSCEPQAGLYLMMQTPGERHSSELILTGTLETPTPGYGYTMDHQNDGAGNEIIVLHLSAPPGMAAAVVSKLAIEERFGVDPATKHAEITIEKKFGWGIDKIICEPLP